jgi:hypothetical protein
MILFQNTRSSLIVIELTIELTRSRLSPNGQLKANPMNDKQHDALRVFEVLITQSQFQYIFRDIRQSNFQQLPYKRDAE